MVRGRSGSHSGLCASRHDKGAGAQPPGRPRGSEPRGPFWGYAEICAAWVTAFIVTTTFPPLLSTVGLSGIFCIYTIASIAAYWTVFRRVRETKGVVLENMPDTGSAAGSGEAR